MKRLTVPMSKNPSRSLDQRRKTAQMLDSMSSKYERWVASQEPESLLDAAERLAIGKGEYK